MRRFVPVLATAVIAVIALAGCSTTVNETRDNAGCGPFRSGASSDAVTATGARDSEPKVRFPTPLHSKGSQVSVVRSGDGAQLGDGQVAKIAVSLFRGGNGAAIQRVGYASDSILFRQAGYSNALDRSLECRRVGDRYALTGPVDRVLGQGAASQLGVSTSSSVVAVVDVEKAFLGKANGQNQLQDNALPQVVTAVDGQPGLVLPNQDPPTARATWTVKEGDGARLAKGTRTVLRYSQFTWGTTATVAHDETWTDPQRAAAMIPAGAASEDAPFARALVGVPIGSQIMYVVPASGGQATVYVIDVLGRL